MKAHAKHLNLALPLVDDAQPIAPARRRLIAPARPTPPVEPVPRARQAWLAIRLPEWSLHAALATLPADGRTRLNQAPLAVMDDDRFRSVLCCNDAAHRHGIRPGHRLNAAIALCATLECLSRNSPAERAHLEALACDCQRFTPLVAVEPPNELLLEVRASLKLFGGIRALIAQVDAHLRACGMTPVMAMSRTPASALWFARASASQRVVAPKDLTTALGALPLHVLHWPPEVRERLRRFGVTQIGDLMRLPRAGLARRIGHERLKELDQAQGRQADLRRTHEPPLRYHDRVILDFEIETTHLAETLIARRFEHLGRFLTRRTAAIRALTITLFHRDLPATPVRVGLATATADLRHLEKLLHETLSSIRLPAPIREILIAADQFSAPDRQSRTLAFAPSQGSLSEGLPHEGVTTARARLLEQLCARLGRDTPRCLLAKEDRRPERTQQEVPVDLDSSGSESAALPALPARPLWLLRKPERLNTFEHETHAFSLIRGPERLCGGWWDGAPVDREYYLMQLREGSLWWVYRNRSTPADLHLHGLFA